MASVDGLYCPHKLNEKPKFLGVLELIQPTTIDKHYSTKSERLCLMYNNEEVQQAEN